MITNIYSRYFWRLFLNPALCVCSKIFLFNWTGSLGGDTWRCAHTVRITYMFVLCGVVRAKTQEIWGSADEIYLAYVSVLELLAESQNRPHRWSFSKYLKDLSLIAALKKKDALWMPFSFYWCQWKVAIMTEQTESWWTDTRHISPSTAIKFDTLWITHYKALSVQA